jgi:predicted O-methyltransferase YrrM
LSSRPITSADVVSAHEHARTVRNAVDRVLVEPLGRDLEELLAPADEWVVSVETAHLLSGLVERLRPQSVLEFGAGRSSLVLATALSACGGGRLTSIEHQPAYARAAWERTTRVRAVDARLIEARLSLRLSKHGLLHEYVGITQALRARAPFDFMFIDAPPGHLGRDTALFTAAPYAASGCVVLLDDAARQWEKTAAHRWMRALPIETVFESDTVGRGVIVLTVLTPKAAAFSLRTFVGTIHDRIIERTSGAARPAGG